MLAVGDEQLHQVLHSDGVEGWHNDLVVGKLNVNIEGLDGVEPTNPLLRDSIELVIVNKFLLWEVDTNLLHLCPHPLVELHPTWKVGGGSDGPNDTEAPDLGQHGEELLDLLVWHLFDLVLNVVSKVTVHDSEKTLDNVVVNSANWLMKFMSQVVASILKEHVTELL